MKKNLSELCKKVVEEKADLGIAVDPDVDRLVFVCENGEIFGEENTLVACSDYVLEKSPGSTVSNLSSSRALADITKKHNQIHFYSAVGEVNVVKKMKISGPTCSKSMGLLLQLKSTLYVRTFLSTLRAKAWLMSRSEPLQFTYNN